MQVSEDLLVDTLVPGKRPVCLAGQGEPMPPPNRDAVRDSEAPRGALDHNRHLSEPRSIRCESDMNCVGPDESVIS